MNIRCSGCGAIIQSTSQEKAGFIEKAVIEKHNDGDFYCKRCFDLRHYNKNSQIEYDEKAYLDNLNSIKNDKGLIVYIIDLFDLEGSFIENINTLFKSENILLVVNKVDLFLDSINKNRLYQYIRKYIKERSLKVKDVFLMSSFNNDDIDELVEQIKIYKDDKQNVYFVGMTNVGKSSILNKIIYKYTNESEVITVSNNVNTTLSNIYIPYNDKTYFIDTPGIINKDSIIYYLNRDSYKAITPKSYIKPKTFQLNDKQTLFIAGFLKIDFIEGDRTTFITNFNNSLLIHRTKLENSDEFFMNHKDDILKYPNEEERKRLGILKSKTVSFDRNNKIDIAIHGLGFLSIYGEGKVKITTYENIKWVIREAIV